MTILGRELSQEEKAAYFDRMVDEQIKWHNCPIEDLYPRDQKQLKDKLEALGSSWPKPHCMSRAEAAGYHIWKMLHSEGILQAMDATRTSGGFQMKLKDNKGMGVIEFLIVMTVLMIIMAAVTMAFM